MSLCRNSSFILFILLYLLLFFHSLSFSSYSSNISMLYLGVAHSSQFLACFPLSRGFPVTLFCCAIPLQFFYIPNNGRGEYFISPLQVKGGRKIFFHPFIRSIKKLNTQIKPSFVNRSFSMNSKLDFLNVFELSIFLIVYLATALCL